MTWGLFSRREEPGELARPTLDLLEETAAAGGRMFAQVHSRALTVVLSFKTNLPFDELPEWKELRALPLAEQSAPLRDPADAAAPRRGRRRARRAARRSAPRPGRRTTTGSS